MLLVFHRFNRFLGLTKDQLAPAALAPAAIAPAALALTIPTVPPPSSSPVASPHNLSVSVAQTEYASVFLYLRKQLFSLTNLFGLFKNCFFIPHTTMQWSVSDYRLQY